MQLGAVAAVQQVVSAYNDLKTSLAAYSAALALRTAAQTLGLALDARRIPKPDAALCKTADVHAGRLVSWAIDP
jgi:hypothetical protein